METLSLGRLKNYEDNKLRYAQLRKAGMCVACAVKPATTSSKEGGNGGKTIKYCEECRQRFLTLRVGIRTELKSEVMSHYSIHGVPQCCWANCGVQDVDMLTLDHVDNSGADARRKNRSHAGITLYALLKRQGYPEGYQTLCHNHQWKKELMRRRRE